MPLHAARRLCPQLVVLPVRHGIYRRYSAQVMALLHELSPLMQQVSIDEAFVELTGRAEALSLLRTASARIGREIGLSCSFGVATSKLVAKIATDQGKPRGFVVVRPDEEAAYLAPLPVEVLWGVGPRTSARLRELDIRTLGALAAVDPVSLAPVFGSRRALELAASARGRDGSPLVLDRQYKSISSEQTLGRGGGDPHLLWHLLQRMAEDVAGRLRAEGIVARTVGIKLRYTDWRLVTRDLTLPQPVDEASRLAAVAAELMRRNWQRGTPLRLLGLRASGLAPAPAVEQLALLPLEA